MIIGLELKIKELIACNLGRNPKRGGIPASDRRSNEIIVFDWGEIFARWVCVFREDLDSRTKSAEMISK